MTVMTGTAHCSQVPVIIGVAAVALQRAQDSQKVLLPPHLSAVFQLQRPKAGTGGQGKDEGNRWALHAPFRRVMKRPASDMTRESNCVYTRGRSPRRTSVPSSSNRALILSHATYREKDGKRKRENDGQQSRLL